MTDGQEDSGYGTQFPSPNDKPYGDESTQNLTVPSAPTPIPGFAEFDKSVDNATLSRFRHVHSILENPLLKYIRSTIRKKNCPISIRLMVLGRSEDDAKPCIVVLCPEQQAKKVRKFFDKKSVRALRSPEDGQPSFEVFVVGQEPETKQADGDNDFDMPPPETKQAPGDIDVLIPIMGKSKGYTNETYCGAPIIIRQASEVDRRCTFGGVIKAVWPNGEMELYGITVGHILLNDLEDDLTASTESDQSRRSDNWEFELSDSDSEDESCDSVKEEDDESFNSVKEEQDDEAKPLCLMDEPQLALPDASSSWAADELSKIGSILKDLPRSQSAATDTKNDEPEVYYDWALIDMISYKPNLIRPRKMSHDEAQEGGVFSSRDHELVISASPSRNYGKRQPVVLVSGSEGLKRGSLSALPSRLLLGPGKVFVDALILNLDSNKQILDGDSGSWVVNEKTLEVYGYVVAADAFGGGYIIPLAEAFQNITDKLGCQFVNLATTMDMASDKLERIFDMNHEPTAPMTATFTKDSVLRSHGQLLNQRRPRARPPDPGVWEQHKTAIYSFYMEQDFTLAATMKLMQFHHQFQATEKMYKDKFKQWKWSKNLPKATAARMLNIANQRLPKRTEFLYNGRKWSMEEIQKRHSRRSAQGDSSLQEDFSIPDDFTYGTPPSSGITDTESVLENSHDTDGDVKMADSTDSDLRWMI
ncbi:hypothetical protein CFAM422_001630 [Trichoderma lentiforme]|uniref:Clr5 domain-containing protein n=1 Tax=Trichoderma lentiforme TaxID=1567552 RepID=A0A9P4XNM7_9HYPO|nr:hypothetical protein CFAM422_001630 [Trichoderma lentiforme]